MSLQAAGLGYFRSTEVNVQLSKLSGSAHGWKVAAMRAGCMASRETQLVTRRQLKQVLLSAPGLSLVRREDWHTNCRFNKPSGLSLDAEHLRGVEAAASPIH